MIIQRRNFLIGLVSGIVCAPAVVRASSLMPVRTVSWEKIVPFDLPLARGPPTCEVCFAAFGMCAHTGGPISYSRDRADRVLLDSRVQIVT